MTEFENNDYEFNFINNISNDEFNFIKENVEENEEFINQLACEVEQGSKSVEKNNMDLSSIQGEIVSRGVGVSVSSSMGAAVSAVALCVASVGVGVYSDNTNKNISTQTESQYEEHYEQPQTIQKNISLEEIHENQNAQTDLTEMKVQKKQQLQVYSLDYTGVYDGQSHSGNIENIPKGAVITYGETMDNINLTKVPQYKDAGEYTVYYKIEKEGYEPYVGNFVIRINKKIVQTPSPKLEETIYNGKIQSPKISSDDGYRYYGTMFAKNAGTYKIKFNLKDIKNYQWSDGTSMQKTVSWVIKPREVTVDWHGEKSYKYNGEKHIIDVTLGNVVPGDFLNFTIKENSAFKPGKYKAEITSIGGSDNYILPNEPSFYWMITE